MKPPTLISIAGIIGVGKTTLAHGLATALGGEVILEEYNENPFLPGQYAHEPDAALASQLFFLLSRIRQLDAKTLQPDHIYISDYIFEKDRIFAQLNLAKPHFDLYTQLAEKLKASLTPATTVIYLHDTVENCLSRIASRGRDYEQAIAPAWLTQLNQAYQTLFKTWTQSPLIKINCDKYDLREPQAIKDIAEKLENGKIAL